MRLENEPGGRASVKKTPIFATHMDSTFVKRPLDIKVGTVSVIASKALSKMRVSCRETFQVILTKRLQKGFTT